MPDIGTNEREFSSLLISWLNDILKTGGHEAKEASGETSVKDDKTLFPDVVLWKSRAENKALTLFELKNTTVHIDDKELLENAMIKAKNLACKYLVTWNVREAAIWDVSKGFPDLINKYPPLVNINSIQDIFIEQTKESLKRRAKEIVQDIDILIQSGKFRAHKLDPILFSAVLKDTVEHLTPEIHKALLHKYQSDKAFKNEFNKWAAEQGIQNYTDQEYFTSASKQIVYRVTGQILFYFALKRQIKSLPDLDISDFDVEKTKQILQDAFEEVRKIDYQAVYEPTLVDDIDWSQEAGLTLQALLKNLAYYDFSNMPLDVIGTVFEELIPPNEQHTLGQYFTPEDLVDFINGFVIQSKEDFVFDPTCGTGTFLVRAYNRFNHLFSLHDHEKLIERIWGNDIAAFPTELTAINLFIRKLDDANNYPRVIRKDFFEVNPGDEVEFPHPRLGIKGGYKMEVPVPMFDGMMGNFPYIRQELIEKAVPGYKKMLSETLAREWLAEYPELFEIPKHAMAGYQKWVESGFDEKMSGKLFEMVEVKLSGQADIYAYMFFHSAKFLKPGGRMAFLTSNSWLDVAYGYELQKFFAKKFKIVAIFESRCEPWFQSASVNTVVTVLERCDDPDEIANHPARFVKIKRKFEDLLPQEDLALEAQQRHIDVDRLVGVIEDETRIGKLIYAYCITEEGPHPKSFSQGEKDFNNLPSPSGRGTEGEGFSGRGTEGEGFSGRGTGGEGFSERGTEGEGFSVESEGSSFSGETSYRYSPKYIIDLARELRQKSNKPEEIMWYLLRDRRFHGLKFRRQHPIDRYIADFYCHEINLVIELDGLVHEEQFQKEYDENRDEYMKASGYNVLRIDADEVMNDCDNVLRLIEDEIIALSPKSGDSTEECPHPKSFSQGEKDLNLPSPSGRGAGGEGFSERGAGGEGFSERGTEGEGLSGRRTGGEGLYPNGDGLYSYEDKNFRIRTVRQGALAEELDNADETVKWGKFLRAPDVYFELMDAIGDKLVPLSEVADVRRGYTTGINEFFYLTPDKAKLYGIEEEYLVSVVKSPKEIDGLVVNPDKLKFRLFMCNKSKDELRAEGHMGALRYIEQVGEKGATKAGVKWPEVPSVRGRKYWWGLPDIQSRILWVVAYGEKLYTGYSLDSIHIDKRLYSCESDKFEEMDLAAILNSALVFLQIEAEIGHVNLGDGAIFCNVIDVDNFLFVPKPEFISDTGDLFAKLLNRKVFPIPKEVKQPDRREMDSAILSALGLDPAEWLDRIYDGLTELVRERLELPKMRNKAKKVRKAQSTEGVIEDLVKDYQDRLRPFPQDFCDLEDWEYIDLPQGQFERCVTNGMMSYCEALYKGKMWQYEFKTEWEALYAYYGQRPKIMLLKRPKSDHALVNAVHDYQRWMDELQERIARDALSRVLSPAESETIAREVMRRLGLKRV